MSEDSDEDLGAIAWPGFVDILSSVIIMFVFFVMVVASALYFHIIIFKSKILSEVSEYTTASSQAQELATTNRTLTQRIKEMEEKMKILEETNEATDVQLYQEHTEFAESEDQIIVEDEKARSITIFFGKDSISVTEENQQKVGEFIQKYLRTFTPGSTAVKIISGKSPDSINDRVARRLALARMLNVRNMFLETEIPPEQVVPSIAGDKQIEGTYNWVTITLEKK